MEEKKIEIARKSEIFIGNFEIYEDEWFEVVKQYALKKLQQITKMRFECIYPSEIKFCKDDECFHFKDEQGRIWHVCYSDPSDVRAFLCPEYL